MVLPQVSIGKVAIIKPKTVTLKPMTSFRRAGSVCSFMNSDMLEVTEKLPLNPPALHHMIHPDFQVRNKIEYFFRFHLWATETHIHIRALSNIINRNKIEVIYGISTQWKYTFPLNRQFQVFEFKMNKRHHLIKGYVILRVHTMAFMGYIKVV